MDRNVRATAQEPSVHGRLLPLLPEPTPPSAAGYLPHVPGHSPDIPPQPPTASRSGRWLLLALYVMAYGGFIGVAVAAPGLLGTRVAGGVNLAVAWGFGLIVLAFVVALAALRLPEGR